MPLTTWTYRIWEAANKYHLGSYGPFYPQLKFGMAEVGGLARNTIYAVKKDCTWEIDSLGYRNSHIPDSIDILFIGDSFIAGASNTQSNTISSIVDSMTGLRTYQLASAEVADFIILYSSGLLPKPKLIIYEKVEREMGNLEFQDLSSFETSPALKTRFKLFEARWNSSALIIIDRLLKNAAGRSMIPDFDPKSLGIPSEIEPSYYFYEGKDVKVDFIGRQPDSIASIILSMQEYFDSKSIDFVFLPIPDKESVYYDLVPLDKRPDYLFVLDSTLLANGINSLNALQIYIDERKRNPNDLLYHTDDSHWNAHGTRIIAKEIVKLDAVQALLKK